MHPALKSVARRVKGNKNAHQVAQANEATADQALAALPPDLKARLGALADAPEEAAELAIALLPYGYRALLTGYGLIEMTAPENESAMDSPRRQIRLRSLCAEIIAACADPPAPVGSVSEVESEAAALRARYEPDLPFEVEEAEF